MISDNAKRPLQSAAVTIGFFLVCVSIIAWLIPFLVDLPDGGEFAAELALVTGIMGPILVLAAFVQALIRRQRLNRLLRIAAIPAAICLSWTVFFSVVMYRAYCCCPSGLC